MWKLCCSIVSMFFFSCIGVGFIHCKPVIIEHNEVRWLSYIPPLELHAIKVEMTTISLKKLDLLNEMVVYDKYAQIENFLPVIDKLIYIPDGYHAYQVKV